MFIQGGAWILMSSRKAKHLNNRSFFIKIKKMINSVSLFIKNDKEKISKRMKKNYIIKKISEKRKKKIKKFIINLLLGITKTSFDAFQKTKITQIDINKNTNMNKNAYLKKNTYYNINKSFLGFLKEKNTTIVIKENNINYLYKRNLSTMLRKTVLNILPKIYIQKRNYPGNKEIGHAAKVANSISKKPAMEILSQTPTQALRTNNSSIPMSNHSPVPTAKEGSATDKENENSDNILKEGAQKFQRDTTNFFYSEKTGEQQPQVLTENSNTTPYISQIITATKESAPYTPGAYIKEHSSESLGYVLTQNKATAPATVLVINDNSTSKSSRQTIDHNVSTVEKSAEPFTQSKPDCNENNLFDGNITVEDVYDVGFSPLPSLTPTIPITPAIPSKAAEPVPFSSPSTPPIPPAMPSITLSKRVTVAEQPIGFNEEIAQKADEINKTVLTSTQALDQHAEQKNQENIKNGYRVDKYLNSLTPENRAIAEQWYLAVSELEKISKENINVLFLALEKRGLLIWDDISSGKGLGGAKLTAKFFSFYKELYSTPTMPLIDDLVTHSTFSAVLLSCKNDTELLDGLQTHVAIMATTPEGIRYIIGYLTSQKEGNFKLADIQELINNKDKGQYIHYLTVAKKITDDSQIEKFLSLESEYINQKKHFDIIKDTLKDNMPNSVENYADIKIFCAEDIQKIIVIFDEKKNEEMQKELKTYTEKWKQAKNKYGDNIKGFFKWKEKYDKSKSAQLGYEWPPAEFQGF